MSLGTYQGQTVRVLESSRLRTSRHNGLPISRIRFSGNPADYWVLTSEIDPVSSKAKGRTMTRMRVEREDFLRELMRTALYHGDYGWFDVRRSDGKKAVIVNQMTGEEHKVDWQTIARGLRIIRTSVVIGSNKTRIDPKTGEPIEFDGPKRDALIEADKSDGARGSYDVAAALTVLECGLFGKPKYT